MKVVGEVSRSRESLTISPRRSPSHRFPFGYFACLSKSRIPSPGKRKIKLNFVACFSAPKNTLSPHHVYHAFHHNSPQKHHTKNTHFPKTPLKNARQSALIPRPTTANFFLKNYRRTEPVDTGTCSTISIPNPCSAGTCVGVFVSSRILRIPRSERICPPNPTCRSVRCALSSHPSRDRCSR